MMDVKNREFRETIFTVCRSPSNASDEAGGVFTDVQSRAGVSQVSLLFRRRCIHTHSAFD